VTILLLLHLALDLPGLASAQGRPEVRDDEVLVKFKPGTPAASQAAAHQQAGGQVAREVRGLDVKVVQVAGGQAENRLLAYRQNPNVEYAELNGIAYADWSPSDQLYRKQWALKAIGQPQAWDVTRGSSAVSIAVLDTGIRATHPDLNGKVVASRNFTSSATDDDRYGHGTHVSGSAAALTDNATGIAGVCANCRVLNGKVLGDYGSGAYDWVANGVLWAVGCDSVDRAGNCLNPPRAKVISMSLGGSFDSLTLHNAVDKAWNRGAVLSCAAGNNSSSTPFYPATYQNCIAVAATSKRDVKASFSNFGQWVDVAAPGDGILSTVPLDNALYADPSGYASWSGTSMATPHVAGLAGLLWSKGLSSQSSVRWQIESTADPISGTGNYWASGRINACRAVGGTGC